MIATDGLVFLHLHKTGGQFVNRLLLQYLPGTRRVGYHLPRSEAPSELRRLPAFAFVRNPWDWYVSWYAFNTENPERNPIFRTVADHGRLGFKPAILNLLRLGEESHALMRDEIATGLPETRENNFGSGITQAVMRHYEAAGIGYLSWLLSYMCAVGGSLSGVHFGRMETLREDFPRLLTECASPPSAELALAISSSPLVNASPHRDYRSYYDQELKEAVGARDRGIVEVYGYPF